MCLLPRSGGSRFLADSSMHGTRTDIVRFSCYCQLLMHVLGSTTVQLTLSRVLEYLRRHQ